MLKTVLFYLLLGMSFAIAASETPQVTHYETQVSFNNEAGGLQVDSRLVIPSTSLKNNTASLFLHKDFAISHISGDTLEDYTVSVSEIVPVWSVITLQFSGDTPMHEIDISYSGLIDAEAGHGNYIDNQSIHLSIDSGWHPVFADFSTPIQGTLHVELPADWKLYGPGKVRQTDKGLQLISEQPTIDVAIYATSQGKQAVDKGFTVVYDTENEDHAGALASMGNECLISLNTKFAATDTTNRLDSATLVLLDRTGPSFARSSYLSVTSELLVNEQQSYHYICHELAHHWTEFGDPMSHHYWMVESFAEYVAAREVRQKFGLESYEAVVADWKQRAQGHDFVWKADVKERAPAMVNYALGPLLLKKLEQKIGDESFNQLLDGYMTTPLTETEALLAELEQLTSKETRQWFEQVLGGDF
ncbi:hypothetical protein CWE09_09445 [Aliidiomarina minuta]|uniref:Peptidase M1 membrane alanine aminopeptidase domain-containing protein n=1 Tax=Aliidiomarina minuta TaxID=880057 RepID=A0A432W9V2_9GAMM|nr:hypothetical protein [Aliidiomarina minuta]RUO26894.1 hypothetical protein CWE09_09445 [Aliidiomarina minuta]